VLFRRVRFRSRLALKKSRALIIDMRANKFYVVAAVVAIVSFWWFATTRSEMYNKTTEEIIQYIKSNDTLNPFMVLGMVKKISSDPGIHRESLRLAKQQKSSELLKLIKSLK